MEVSVMLVFSIWALKKVVTQESDNLHDITDVKWNVLANSLWIYQRWEVSDYVGRAYTKLNALVEVHRMYFLSRQYEHVYRN